MSIWNRLCGFFGFGIEGLPSHGSCEINPATGLPMIDGWGGVDVAGNPFGTNTHDSTSFGTDIHDSFSTGSGISDTFSSGMDSFGSSDFSSFDDSSWSSWGD